MPLTISSISFGCVGTSTYPSAVRSTFRPGGWTRGRGLGGGGSMVQLERWVDGNDPTPAAATRWLCDERTQHGNLRIPRGRTVSWAFGRMPGSGAGPATQPREGISYHGDERSRKNHAVVYKMGSSRCCAPPLPAADQPNADGVMGRGVLGRQGAPGHDGGDEEEDEAEDLKHRRQRDGHRPADGGGVGPRARRNDAPTKVGGGCGGEEPISGCPLGPWSQYPDQWWWDIQREFKPPPLGCPSAQEWNPEARPGGVSRTRNPRGSGGGPVGDAEVEGGDGDDDENDGHGDRLPVGAHHHPPIAEHLGPRTSRGLGPRSGSAK